MCYHDNCIHTWGAVSMYLSVDQLYTRVNDTYHVDYWVPRVNVRGTCPLMGTKSKCKEYVSPDEYQG